MACSAPCCPPSCTTQVVFPNSISISTSNSQTLNPTTSGIGTTTTLTVGPATYFPSVDATTLPIAYGGGCETLDCCPCTIYYTVALINPNVTTGANDIALSGTFAINIHDECCATIPSTILTGLSQVPLVANTGVLYPTTAILGFDPCKNIRTITVMSINIVIGATITVPSPPCCTTGCLQPCDVTAITASAATGTTGTGTQFDVLTIGSIVLARDATSWKGGGGYTLCTSPDTIVLPVTLRNTQNTDHTGNYLAGCLRLCVTGMFGFVQLESTTLYGYNTTTSPVTAITRTLTGSANISFCNGVRTINLANINLT